MIRAEQLPAGVVSRKLLLACLEKSGCHFMTAWSKNLRPSK
jgi:hypothetical protein